MPDSPLASRVIQLEEQVRRLRELVLQLESRLIVVEGTSAGFELVGTVDSERGSGYSAATSQSVGTAPAAKASPPGGATRSQILQRIADWLLRSLAGEHRGSSGRDSLAGPSRYYIIARDFAGRDFNPLKVVNPWSVAEPFVKRGGSAGEAVFIGVPRWDDVLELSQLTGLAIEHSDGRAR